MKMFATFLITSFQTFVSDLKIPNQILKISNKKLSYCIDKIEFPNDLKHVDIVPVYKKNNKCEKENYSSASVLSLMYNQLYNCFDNLQFPSQCGFQKEYSTQHCLLVMIEKLIDSYRQRE